MALPRLSFHRRTLPIVALMALSFACAPTAMAAAPGLSVQPAAAQSAAAPGLRIALLIVPPSAVGRGALAHADEESYRRALKDIGFEVWTVGPLDRPLLEKTLRDAASRVPEGAQVAVFALGQSIGGADDVFLVPHSSPADLAQRPQFLESEGLRLGDLLRRIASRQPRDLVAVVDECLPAAGNRCDFEATVGQSNASVIGGERTQSRGAGNTPLAGRVSLREPFLAAMLQEGLPLLGTYTSLKERLAGSNVEPRSSATVSGSFAFVPRGFFAGLRTDCNRVDPTAEFAAIRATTLDPLIRACEAAVTNYPYAQHFSDRLGAGREQRALQRAVASCDDRLSTAAYGTGYPAGRFRSIVDSFSLDCDRQRDRQIQEAETQRREEADRRQRELDEQRRKEEADRRQRDDDAKRQEEARQQEDARRQEEVRRQEEARRASARSIARSEAGWQLSYADALLEIDPLANDHFDAQRNTYNTVWRSRLHGEQVAIYLQVSMNRRCGDARQYALEQIAPRRIQVTRSQDMGVSTARSGYILEGRGTNRVGSAPDDRAFLDFISIRRDDRSTITHIGGRFPAEHSEMYRAELLRMMNSMQMPQVDIYSRRCN
jgi:hypothetical protein